MRTETVQVRANTLDDINHAVEDLTIRGWRVRGGMDHLCMGMTHEYSQIVTRVIQPQAGI